MKPDCVLFDGEYYSVGRGSSSRRISYGETVTVVDIVDENHKKIVFRRTGENTMEVTADVIGFGCLPGTLPAGTVETRFAKSKQLQGKFDVFLAILFRIFSFTKIWVLFLPIFVCGRTTFSTV